MDSVCLSSSTAAIPHRLLHLPRVCIPSGLAFEKTFSKCLQKLLLSFLSLHFSLKLYSILPFPETFLMGVKVNVLLTKLEFSSQARAEQSQYSVTQAAS